MTSYGCPYCGQQFRPGEYGEFLQPGQVVISFKAYQASLAHIASCPKNPPNANRPPSRQARASED